MVNPIRAVLLIAFSLALQAATVYDGTTTGWSANPSANALALSELGVPSGTTLLPDPSLGSFVLVHNGPGDEATEATFFRSFSVGVDGGNLTFSGWFVTLEPTGTNSMPPGIDSFSVALSGTINQIFLSGDVTATDFTCFDGTPPANVPCSVSAMTPTNLNFSEFQPKFESGPFPLVEGEYTITFTVRDDPGDPNFDSGFLIYGVNVTDGNPVPEPSTLLMMACGLVALAAAKRKL